MNFQDGRLKGDCMRKEIIRASHLRKRYEDSLILKDFNINLYEGEVMGIIGLHDSGKSTVLNILSGKEAPSEGSIFFNENKADMRELYNQGRVFLLQKNSALIDTLSVLDNIFVVKKHNKKKVWLNQGPIYKQLVQKFEELGITISPLTKVGNLTEEGHHIIEIVKAYILGAKVIFIDDILTGYSNEEYTYLIRIIEKLRKKGLSFIIAGHQVEKIQMYADRIIFLVNGKSVKVIKNMRRNQIDPQKILFEDTRLSFEYPAEKQKCGDARFKVMNLHGEGLNNSQLQFNKGEIVLVIDILKNTNQRLFQWFNNENKCFSADIYIDDKFYDKRTKKNSGLLLTEDFNTENKIVECLSLRDNLCLSQYKKFLVLGFIKKSRVQYVKNDFLKWVGEWRDTDSCRHLSQKEKINMLLYGIELKQAKVLLCKNPEEVVDYNDYLLIENRLKRLAQNGMSIGIFASNINRVQTIADSFIFISDGRIKGKYSMNEFKTFFYGNDK